MVQGPRLPHRVTRTGQQVDRGLGVPQRLGTFVAGILRSIAPKASVFVERAFDIAGADYETRVAASLEDALDRDPDILVFTFTTATHGDQPLVTFDDLFERRIRYLKGLVALRPGTRGSHALCGRPPIPGLSPSGRWPPTGRTGRSSATTAGGSMCTRPARTSSTPSPTGPTCATSLPSGSAGTSTGWLSGAEPRSALR